jgi:hypothetical protein
MMWTQYQAYEPYDWDEQDQSYRKMRKIEGKTVWLDVHESIDRHAKPMREGYTWVSGETVYQKERPV